MDSEYFHINREIQRERLRMKKSDLMGSSRYFYCRHSHLTFVFNINKANNEMLKIAEKLQIKSYATGKRTPEKTLQKMGNVNRQWQIHFRVSSTSNSMRLNYSVTKNYYRT